MIMLFSFLFVVGSQLIWDKNTEQDLSHYNVYIGYESSTYSIVVDSVDREYFWLTGLTENRTYYLAVTAVDTAGNESMYSNEVIYGDVKPSPPYHITINDSVGHSFVFKDSLVIKFQTDNTLVDGTIIDSDSIEYIIWVNEDSVWNILHRAFLSDTADAIIDFNPTKSFVLIISTMYNSIESYYEQKYIYLPEVKKTYNYGIIIRRN